MTIDFIVFSQLSLLNNKRHLGVQVKSYYEIKNAKTLNAKLMCCPYNVHTVHILYVRIYTRTVIVLYPYSSIKAIAMTREGTFKI